MAVKSGGNGSLIRIARQRLIIKKNDTRNKSIIKEPLKDWDISIRITPGNNNYWNHVSFYLGKKFELINKSRLLIKYSWGSYNYSTVSRALNERFCQDSAYGGTLCYYGSWKHHLWELCNGVAWGKQCMTSNEYTPGYIETWKLCYSTTTSMESTLQRQNAENLKQIFPEKDYRGLSPNFHIHVCVSE